MQQLLEPVDRLAQRSLTRTDLSHRRLYLAREVWTLLRIGRRTFQRKAGSMPWVQEVLPRRGRPVYLAAPLDRYLSGLWPCHDPIVRQQIGRGQVRTLDRQEA